MSHPMCFTAQQWRQWQAAARQAKASVSPCEDCSERYAAQMVKEQRCFPVTVEKDHRYYYVSPYKKAVGDDSTNS